MLARRRFLAGGMGLIGAALLLARRPARAAAGFEVNHPEQEWRQLLSPNQFEVLRHGATERPHSSPLDREHRNGRFGCAGCQLPVFSSSRKFDSGTGWPSFWAPLEHAVAANTDMAFGVLRTEVHCRRCGGHLGHVFDDGPQPTGMRYCLNGLALTFSAGPT